MKKLVLIATAFISISASAADRSWVLDAGSLVSFLLSNSVKPDNGSSYNIDSQTIKIGFGYNTGNYEFGPILAYQNASANGVSEKTQTLGGYYRYNFIPNTTLDNVIPFAKMALTTSKVDNGAGTTDQLGWKLAGGATFFPFNDMIGIDGTIAYRDIKSTGNIPGKITGLELGTAFNLYF